jgi:hypothetical protein
MEIATAMLTSVAGPAYGLSAVGTPATVSAAGVEPMLVSPCKIVLLTVKW